MKTHAYTITFNDGDQDLRVATTLFRIGDK